MELNFTYFVGSTDQESSQQVQTWFSEHFSRQNLLRSFSLVLFLVQRYKYGAKKCPKNHVRFDFWDASTLANQKTGKKQKKNLWRSLRGTNKFVMSFALVFRHSKETLGTHCPISCWRLHKY